MNPESTAKGFFFIEKNPFHVMLSRLYKDEFLSYDNDLYMKKHLFFAEKKLAARAPKKFQDTPKIGIFGMFFTT